MGNVFLANIYLVIRFFTDILDGAVARKYNKTSKLGGYLDTTNDLILFTMYTYIISLCLILKNKKHSRIFTLIILLCMIIYLKNIDGLSDHTPIKNGKNNKILAFFTNNTIFLFGFLYYFNKNYLCKDII
tara:strand:- start:223 stop:612 length:390 start_codon:yes stop_codon:yes gene_type:complete